MADGARQYEQRRQNFVAKVKAWFQFLGDDFGYEGPDHTVSRQANGVVTCDRLTYLNAAIDRQITFSNAYHPNDYGFEPQFYRPSISTAVANREMVHYALKENQDGAQTYLREAVALLKGKYSDVVAGRDWPFGRP